MNISEIVSLRSGFNFSIKTVFLHKNSLEEVLKKFKLFPNVSDLKEIDYEEAVKVVKTILWKDLAYGEDFMSKDKALSSSTYIINQYYSKNYEIFTNGDWVNYHLDKGASFNPLTKATFNFVVIIIGAKTATCILAEDED